MFVKMSVSVAVLVALASQLAAEEARRITRFEQELSGGTTCRLEHVVGRIKVRPSPDRTCRLTAVVTARAGTAEEARKDLERVRVEVDADTDRFVARSVFDNERVWSRLGPLMISRFKTVNVEVLYDLQLPAGARLDLSTVSGHVDVEGVAVVKARSTSGSMRLAGIESGLDARSVSGAIEVSGVAGNLRVNSVSGPVNLAVSAGVTGAEVETTSGAVTVKAQAGAAGRVTVDARSVSGRIDNQLPRGGPVPLRIATISGDIRATVVP